jgi:hypothetical protein
MQFSPDSETPHKPRLRHNFSIPTRRRDASAAGAETVARLRAPRNEDQQPHDSRAGKQPAAHQKSHA